MFPTNGVELDTEEVRPAKDSGFFRAVLAHYLHLDRIMWSRMQYLGLVQAAAISGSYSLHSMDAMMAAVVLLLLSSVVSLLLLLMMRRDEYIRDSNRNLLTKLGSDLAQTQYKEVMFILSPEPDWKTLWLRGRHYNLILFCLFILVDLGGVVYLLWKVSLGEGILWNLLARFMIL